MTTTPQPGDRVRVTYETVVSDTGWHIGKGHVRRDDAENARVQIIKRADTTYDDPWRMDEWDALPNVCFIQGCESSETDDRGPIFLRDNSMHKACPEHWEPIMSVLGEQSGSDDAARWTPDVPEAACGAVREETGIRCGEPAGHTGHHKGTSTDEHGAPVFSRWSNTEANHG